MKLRAAEQTDATHGEMPVSPSARRAGIDFLKWLACVVAFVALIVGGLILASLFLFGSIADGLHWLRGEPLTLETGTLTFEDLTTGEQRELAFVIENHGFSPVHVLGSNSSCGCVKIQDLPLEIPARGTIEVPLTVTALPGPTTGEIHSQTVIFNTNLQSQPRLIGIVRGRMIAE